MSRQLNGTPVAIGVVFYENLHVIVLKGTPEGVALIEQTVAAMKENAGGKKTGAPGTPRPF